MWVTLYSDASLREGISGWGVWLRSERGRIVEKGRCDDWVNDINAAELFAVYKALELTVAAWPETKGMQVNTDNQVVLRSLWPWSPAHSHPTIKRAQDLVRELLKKHEIRVRTKHVKSHQKGDDVRSWLNNRCDKLAGQMTGKFGSKYVVKPSTKSSSGTTESGLCNNSSESHERPSTHSVRQGFRVSPIPTKLPSTGNGAGPTV